MTTIVTGAAGFIGSHLCELLLSCGDEVRGIDSFTDYYARSRKQANLAPLLGTDGFTFVEADLNTVELAPLLDGVDVVYHLAGQPGITTSWGLEFERYVRDNVLATQRLLEACRQRKLSKFVYASSSSVYGQAGPGAVRETDPTRPISPYGVTKLAAERLCDAYRIEFSLPTASLRLFTVYGPRQRPDMAFARLIASAVHGGTFELHGDGSQTRDFTFVADVVAAMRAAASSDWIGVANIGGGEPVSMNRVLALVESICGPLDIRRGPRPPGDMKHTAADIGVAALAFGYVPRTSLRDGIEAMTDWEHGRQPVPA